MNIEHLWNETCREKLNHLEKKCAFVLLCFSQIPHASTSIYRHYRIIQFSYVYMDVGITQMLLLLTSSLLSQVDWINVLAKYWHLI